MSKTLTRISSNKGTWGLCVVLWSPLLFFKLVEQGSKLVWISTQGLKVIEEEGLPLHWYL